MLKHFEQSGTVTTDLTQVAVLTGLEGDAVLNMEITNTGATNALADFSVELKDHPSGEYYTYVAGATTPTWTTTQSAVTMGIFPFVSGAPLTLAALATAHIILRVYGAWAIRIKAKSAAATTTVRVRGSIS